MEKAIAKPKSSPMGGNIFLSRKDIAYATISIFGFFLGRVVFFQVLNPIAIGFLANFFSNGFLFYFIVGFTTIGLATKLGGLYLVKYLLCIILCCCTNLYFAQKRYTPNIIIKSTVGAVAVIVSGIAFALMNSFSLYFVLMALLEGVLTFTLTYVLKKATLVVAGTKKRKLLGSEEIISIAILMGAIISGAADIYIGSVSLKMFMATVVILIVSFKGGCSLGAMGGMLLGLMLYITGFSDIYSAIIFSLCGIFAGIFKERGKMATIAGFIVGGGISVFYLTPYMLNIELLFSVVSGVILFLLMPDYFYFNVNSSINPVMDNAEEYILRVKEISTNKLNSFANAFGKLSQRFSNLSEKRSNLDQKDISKLIDDIATKACGSCGMKVYCWQTNFYDTYQTIFSILGACEKKGKIEISDIPNSFKDNCVNLSKFTEISNKLFEFNKINLVWHNRIIESRELVSQQLSGVSNLIKNLSNELDLYINFKEDLEESIIAELNKNKVEVDTLIVLENKLGKYEVTISHKPCYGKKNCSKDIVSIVSKVLGKKMKKSDSECIIKKGVCRMRIVEEQKYRVTSGVARLTKSSSRESGDSYSFMEFKNGQCLLALSDGMGSGNRAREESAAAIELLEDFIESGFEKEMAIRMINSALVLKSTEDSFSTLDICSINLYTAEAEFVKIGASTTFLLRNGVVQVIKSTSLPIGILNDVDLEVSTRKLKHNDMIIMVTDGVTEVSDTYVDKGAWIIDALNSFKGINPQDIADYILAEAENQCNGVIKDDMTVLVARIWERP